MFHLLNSIGGIDGEPHHALVGRGLLRGGHVAAAVVLAHEGQPELVHSSTTNLPAKSESWCCLAPRGVHGNEIGRLLAHGGRGMRQAPIEEAWRRAPRRRPSRHGGRRG